MACCKCYVCGCGCSCDTPPKLVFVSQDGRQHSELYIDGERVNGIRDVRITHNLDDAVIHEVEYLTAFSGKNGRP